MITELLIIFFSIFVDLVTKAKVTEILQYNPDNRYVVLKGVFSFEEAKNDGATFGVFQNNRFMLITLPIIFIVLLFAYLIYNTYKKGNFKKVFKTNLLRVSICFIIGGGIGNLYDRIKFDYVRDFIKYDFLEAIIGRDFAIGNMADIFLIFGVVLLIMILIITLAKEYSVKLEKIDEFLEDEK